MKGESERDKRKYEKGKGEGESDIVKYVKEKGESEKGKSKMEEKDTFGQ